MVINKYPPFLKHESHLLSLKLPTSVNRKGCDEITCITYFPGNLSIRINVGTCALQCSHIMYLHIKLYLIKLEISFARKPFDDH